jgi:hypothetical protein
MEAGVNAPTGASKIASFVREESVGSVEAEAGTFSSKEIS